jgi:alkanesulfonate monooxygenase SsuD/methylene tetrahydromethanopterin reductase-like flavin-dependent oxidoreductase (luciferase family)
MRFLPRLVQRPGVPVWVAGSYGEPKPPRRAARHQGFFPVNLEHADQIAAIVADLTVLRRHAGKGTSAGTLTTSAATRVLGQSSGPVNEVEKTTLGSSSIRSWAL